MGAGHVFGGLEIVRENFSLVILGIIVVSILPGVVEFIRARRSPARPAMAPVERPSEPTAPT
jgi:membrane-associated protein